MKTCSKCKIEKELKEFYKDKRNKDGLKNQCKACKKEYRENNKEAIKEYKKEYRENNRDVIKEYQKEHYRNNKEYRKEYQKEWNKNNKEYRKEYKKEYCKNRRKTDSLYALKMRLRVRTSLAFKNGGYSKTSRTAETLGASFKTAFKHIEKQFIKGMSWDNMELWQIDHIIPLASANNEEELLELCHYSNLQPLWITDNLEKSDNVPLVSRINYKNK